MTGDRQGLSMTEAAAFLGVSLPLLKRLLYTGVIKSVKAGRRRIVSREECQRFLREGSPPAS